MPKEWRATKPIKQAARELRRAMTPAERRLWSVLRNRRIGGLRFRRQHPIGRVVVDFCCVEERLVIEVDGAVHQFRAEYDEDRTAWLNGQGYRVMRFTNDEVTDNPERVVEAIRMASGKQSHSDPQRREKGGD